MLDREVENAVDEFKGMFKTFGYFLELFPSINLLSFSRNLYSIEQVINSVVEIANTFSNVVMDVIALVKLLYQLFINSESFS